MHAISSYHGNRPTKKQTHRQGRLQYTAMQLARSVTGTRCQIVSVNSCVTIDSVTCSRLCSGITCTLQKQDVVVLPKPDPVDYMFYNALVVAFVCKLFELVCIVVNVVTVNAFFIDWEQVRHCEAVSVRCLYTGV